MVDVNLALFDFDGTITFGDTWTPFMRLAVRPSRRLAARVLLAPRYIAYRCGVVDVGRVREMATRIGFSGEAASGVRDLGRRYASETLHDSFVRRPPSGSNGTERAAMRSSWCRHRSTSILVHGVRSAVFRTFARHWNSATAN